MNSIENVANKIRNLEEANQEYINSHNEALKEMVTEAEKFLKKYGFFNWGIQTTLEEDKIEKVLHDLNIFLEDEEKIARCKIVWHVSSFSKTARYYLTLPIVSQDNKKLVEMPRKASLSYGIGLRIFRKKDLKEGQIYEFEVNNVMSVQLTDMEKAFVYSLLIPYTRYKEELVRFCEEADKKYQSDVAEWRMKWHRIVSEKFNCSREMVSCMEEFYKELFFDELHSIWEEKLIALYKYF